MLLPALPPLRDATSADCCCLHPSCLPALPTPNAPAGLTVAVKRDRAMESLLPVGASFVLNVLAEGREKTMMKQVGAGACL